MLEIKKLSHGFGQKKIIQDVSYHFTPGIYGLLGPNGAGKTTLMRCMTGIYTVKSGTILYENQPIGVHQQYFNEMSYLPQKFGLFKNLTVKEMLLMMASLKGVDVKAHPDVVEKCVEVVNLSEKLNEKVKTLSGGMIRRLGIAQTLLNDPKVIALDEPTAGLDIEERLRFKNIITEISKGKVIIISTHIASDIEALCDEVLVMKDKHISFSGSCEAIRQQAKQKTYVLPAELLQSIKGAYHIQNKFEKEGQLLVKILMKNAVDVTHLEQVEPTIEDGYICLLKDI